MSGTAKKPTLRSKLIKRTSILAVAGLTAIILFFLYAYQKHDLEMLRTEMQARAELLSTGLLSTMMSTGDREMIRKTVETYMKISSVPFRIFESKYVQNQFGGHPDEAATDPIVIDVLEGRSDEYDELSGSTFRYVIPIISDKRCQRCHKDLNDDPIPVGTRLGVMEFNFDISDRRRGTLILVSEILLGLSILIVTLVYSLYRMFDKSVLLPLRELTNDFAGLEKEKFNITLPEQETREIDILVKQVRKTAATLKKKKKDREKALEEEQKKVAQIRSFALHQTDQLGITDEDEITHIITRLSRAVKEVEKNELLTGISKWVTSEQKKLTLNNDIDLVRPAAFYLTELVSTFNGSVKKGSMELALEETITNAMVHGNLEIQSSLKEESFEKFDRQIKERSQVPPYSERKVRISYDYGDGKARFTISDEGSGFDWRSFIKKGETDQLELHGRGIIIMRTFANSLEFNEKGNAVTLTFEIDRPTGGISAGSGLFVRTDRT